MKYILMTVDEREIADPQLFDTFEDAHQEMCGEIGKVLGVPASALRESYLEGEPYDGQTTVLENSAWTEKYGKNYDWKIVKLPVVDETDPGRFPSQDKFVSALRETADELQRAYGHNA